METGKRNEFVPTETILRYVKKELKQAYAKIVYQSLTIKHLQKNIKMLLEDPEFKKEIAIEARIRQCNRHLALIEQKLHEARVDRERIMEKYAKLQLKLHEQESLMRLLR